MEVLLAVLLIILLVAIVRSLQEMAAAQKHKRVPQGASVETREAEPRRAAERQRDCAERLVRNCKESLDGFELLPGQLIAAEESLDQAEARFEEGAFAPFWDSIEQAVRELGGFDTEVRSLNSRLTTYDTLVKEYEGQPPEFPIDRDCVSSLTVSARTAERLRSIVYKAQCNPQFAEIYEQRKTSPVLVAGFATFANALALMSSALQSSIGQLAGSVGQLRSQFNDRLPAAQINPANPASLSPQHHQEAIRELRSAAIQRKASALGLLENWEQKAKRDTL